MYPARSRLPVTNCLPPSSPDQEETTLLTLEEKFEALFSTYRHTITAYLSNLLGDTERGQELAQETFLRAYRALARGVEVEHPRAWLYRIATNAARDQFRRARLVRWVPLQEGDHDPALRLSNPSEVVADRLVVRSVLARLAPEYRIPLLLHLAEGLSTAEVAEALGLSRNAVKMRLYRAREQFRQVFRAINSQETEENEL